MILPTGGDLKFAVAESSGKNSCHMFAAPYQRQYQFHSSGMAAAYKRLAAPGSFAHDCPVAMVYTLFAVVLTVECTICAAVYIPLRAQHLAIRQKQTARMVVDRYLQIELLFDRFPQFYKILPGIYHPRQTLPKVFRSLFISFPELYLFPDAQACLQHCLSRYNAAKDRRLFPASPDRPCASDQA